MHHWLKGIWLIIIVNNFQGSWEMTAILDAILDFCNLEHNVYLLISRKLSWKI